MPSSGGRKSLDAEINLVPFIDLLSVCICFLLMTAVWTQISTVQVKQSHGTEAGPAGNYELDMRFGGPTSIEMQLKKNGKNFKKATFKNEEFNALLASVDGQLTNWLSAIPAPAVEPGQKPTSAISAAMVSPKTGVSYGNLVSAMDVLRKHHIVNLGVVPVAESK